MPRVDDVLRYAYRQGPGRDFVAPLGPPERPLTTSFGTLPAAAATDRVCPLVWGTVDLLDNIVYPGRGAGLELSAQERMQHALVMAFGLQRREPSNLFNDHRSSASVRCKFPVHTFVYTDTGAWLLDVYRHGLLPLYGACPTWPDDQPIRIALTGRYTHLPSLYGRLRGPLTELEIGIALRSLWVALEVMGVRGELRLPHSNITPLMAQLALSPEGEWSAPVTVALDQQLPSSVAPAPGCDQASGARPSEDDHDDEDDPTLAEVVAVNRTSLMVSAGQTPEGIRGGADALPAGVAAGARSWSDVLWERNAGRMPRLMAGVSGRRRPVAAAVVHDAVAWVAAPPPTPLLETIARRVTVSACLQDAEGHATGWYRLGRPDAPGHDGRREDRPRLDLLWADPSLPVRLESCYGHGVGPTVGCAVRHACMIWMLSADVASLLDEFGPGAWTLAQYVTGWMAHGLCLAAAAHGLYARPSRAFDEVLLHPVVGMAPGEIVLLSVVSGTARFTEPVLDLRT